MRLLLCLAALLLPSAAGAEEHIRSFLSDVSIAKDGTLSVTETIRVQAGGDNIRRGIFRDFPTRYQDRRGRTVRVGFEVLGVQRDGQAEPYAVEGIDNGERVRIGDADRLLEPGEHEYVIRYETDRQLGFFEDFDELYWNATGTGWMFPIDVAEARIRLPEPAQFGNRAVYTGPQGSTAADAQVISEEPGAIVFRTTRPLGPYEGLTVAAAWPKGVVTAPTPPTPAQLWLQETGPLAAGLLGLGGLLLYYFYAWRRAGRGPDAGTIVPLFNPPDGLTAAALRYVSEMGFDNRTFSAAIVECGVRGKIRLVEEDGGFFSRTKTTIERTGDAADLPEPERAMHAALFALGDRVLLDNENHKTVGGAQTALRKGLERAYRGTMFVENMAWSGAGLLLIGVAVAFAAAVVILADPFAIDGAFLAPTATFVCFGLCAWLGVGSRRWSSMRRILAIIGAVLTLIAGGLAAFATIGLAMESDRPWPVFVPLLALPLGISAFWWMAAPTKAGRAAMDRIAGFRRYLSVTEEDRLETMHPPEKTPELFERYLPHAIALEVENRWASRFTGVLAAAAAAGQSQAMGWYSGNRDPWSDPDGFADRVGSSLSSTVASASTAPGSSSGSGGGGSSGGGGGGGGGGGW